MNWYKRWQERRERRRERLRRRRERILRRGEKRKKRIEEVRSMKERLIVKGIIALLRAILPALERRAKESPSPIDDIVIGVLKAIIGMEKEIEEDNE